MSVCNVVTPITSALHIYVAIHACFDAIICSPIVSLLGCFEFFSTLGLICHL